MGIFVPFDSDGFVKSPTAASIQPRRWGASVEAIHESLSLFSVFARLASGAFYKTIISVPFCEIINSPTVVFFRYAIRSAIFYANWRWSRKI